MSHAWAEAISAHAVESRTAGQVIGALGALEDAALAFCRLLERWARGEADPPTTGARASALQDAAEGVERALAMLDEPLGQYLLELEGGIAEGRSWFGEPSGAELIDWGPVLDSRGHRRLAAPGRRRVPRAGSPRAGARRALGRCQVRGEPGSRLALGRPLRPA